MSRVKPKQKYKWMNHIKLNMHRAEIRQLKNGLNLWKENYIRTLFCINNLLIHFLSFDFVHNFHSMGNGQQIKLTWTPHLESHPYVRWRHHLWSSCLVLFVQFCTLHIHALISTRPQHRNLSIIFQCINKCSVQTRRVKGIN